MAYRTDLAVESAARATGLPGVRQRTFPREGFTVTATDVTDEAAARTLGKPVGQYRTLSLDALFTREQDAFPRAARALASLLGELLAPCGDGPVLVIGLGNRAITPDAIGPQAVTHVIATRHLIEQVPEHFQGWRPVAAVAPGVLGQTGVEAAELVDGVRRVLRPAAVLAVDALACARLSRLLRTIQLSDVGIVPGAGVGNARAALNRETLGVPVLAIGVPTVVDGATLAHEIGSQTRASCEALEDLAQPVLVTTRDIDREVADIARIIGYAINLALHPHLTLEDIDLCLR